MPSLAPQPRFRFFTAGGSTTPVRPLVGGKVYFYAAGTTTPKDTYTDSTGTTPNTNPVILDARGEADIWLGGGAYKMVVTDALGVQQGGAVDGIEGMDSLRAYVDELRQDLNDASGGDFTLPLGAYTYIFGDGVADNSDAITAANAAGKSVFVVGRLNITSPRTLTVPIVDTMARIFTDSSQITIANGQPVRPEWFGSTAGNIMRAVNALPSTGGTVQLALNTYPPSYSSLTAAKVVGGTGVAGADYLAKSNVRIIGAKVPALKAAVGGVVPGLQGGTIVQGPFFVQAANFEIDALGVDSGPDVCAALYAGAAQEGLMLLQANQAAPTYNGGTKVGKVIGLGKGGSELVHACLFEALTDATIQEATGAQSFHGVVVKSQNVKAGFLRGLENGGEGVICKSDAYAPMGNVQIDQVESSSIDAGVDNGFGFLVDAVGAPASSVQVGIVRAYRKANGAGLRSGGSSLSDVRIGSVISEGCPNGFLHSGDVRRTHVDSVIVNNATNGVRGDTGVIHKSNSIGRLVVTNTTDAMNCDAIAPKVGSLTVDGASAFALNYTTTSTRYFVEESNVISAAAFWPLQPTLGTGWSQFAGGAVFRLTMASGGRIRLSGKVAAGVGVTTTLCSTLSVQIRPPEELEFDCPAWTGAAFVLVTVRITAAGVVTVQNFGAIGTGAGNYLVLNCDWPIPY